MKTAKRDVVSESKTTALFAVFMHLEIPTIKHITFTQDVQ